MTAPTPTQQSRTVKLSAPITRGQTTLNEITLRPPRAADLKGLPLTGLLNMETNALAQLITRISTPSLITQEIDAMPVDAFLQLAGEVLHFFVPPEQAATLSLTA